MRSAWQRSAVREQLRLITLRVLSLRRINPAGVSHLHLHGVPQAQAADFERLLDGLLEHGPIVPLREGVEREARGDPRPAFTLSFDDGYRSMATVAGPILARRGVPALVFVASGFVGLEGEALRRYMVEGLRWPHVIEPMTLRDLRSWIDLGLEVGSHGVTHRPFSEMDEDDARCELAESKAYLERATGQTVSCFAWPFGKEKHFPRRFVPLARSVGYEHLFSGVSRKHARELPAGVLPRRQLSLDWGLPINMYFALRG